MYLISGYLLLMNLIGFVLMGIDKKKAVRKAWRIPEKTLLLAAFLGGGIGSFLGMYLFRHKTKHLKFVLLLPVSAVIYGIILYKLVWLICT
jgi:Predicted membrane protein